MKYRKFGKQPFEVSEIGLGTWQLGSDAWGNVDAKTAETILAKACENGVTFFDTADVYGAGLSEERIGRYLARVNKNIFVATKLGRFGIPGGLANYSLDSFRRHTEASLKRLGRDCLDLTQLHCIPPTILRQGKVFDWLRILQREGKIQYFGASVESMDDALFCLEQEGLASLQIIFNLLRQKPVTDLFDLAKEKGVALIIRLPLASGILSGKLTPDSSFAKNDHRFFNKDGAHFNVGETFAGIPYDRALQLAEEVSALVPSDWTLADLALRWILDFDAVTTIIPGATKPEQAASNARVSDLPPLSYLTHETLRNFYQTRAKQLIRGPY